MVHKVENTQPEAFSKVKVYGADPWYPAIIGKIRSLDISNLGKKIL